MNLNLLPKVRKGTRVTATLLAAILFLLAAFWHPLCGERRDQASLHYFYCPLPAFAFCRS